MSPIVSAPSACTDRKAWKQGTAFRSSLCQTRGLSLSKIERETVYKIVLGRVKYANHLGGYWFNLEIGSNLPTLWLDLPCS